MICRAQPWRPAGTVFEDVATHLCQCFEEDRFRDSAVPRRLSRLMESMGSIAVSEPTTGSIGGVTEFSGVSFGGRRSDTRQRCRHALVRHQATRSRSVHR